MSFSSSLVNFSGTWRLNLERSTIRGPLPNHVVVKIEHEEPKLEQEVISIDSSGHERRQTFTCEIGLESINTVQGSTARTHARWEGAELVIETWMKAAGRDLHFKDHWSISDDGQTLSMIHRDDDLAGQTSILERTP